MKKTKEDILQLITEVNEVANRDDLKCHELDEKFDELLKAVIESDIPEEKKENNLRILKRQRWSINHLEITQAFRKIVAKSNLIPSAYLIAQNTGLSRQTVSKHLKEFNTHELYSEEIKIQEYAANMLMGNVLALAVEGDLKAMKFYMEVVEKRKQASSITNNFIQINNIFINKETIKSLPEVKQQAIEEIILSSSLNSSTFVKSNGLKLSKS